MKYVRNGRKILDVGPHDKIPLVKLRSIWRGNIKIDLREIEPEGVDWNRLGRDGGGGQDSWRTFVITVMNRLVPEKTENFWLAELLVASQGVLPSSPFNLGIPFS
jgi:hypothetical protein